MSKVVATIAQATNVYKRSIPRAENEIHKNPQQNRNIRLEKHGNLAPFPDQPPPVCKQINFTSEREKMQNIKFYRELHLN